MANFSRVSLQNHLVTASYDYAGAGEVTFGALITVIILCFRTLKNNYFGENKGCPKIYGIYGMYFRSVRDVFSNV